MTDEARPSVTVSRTVAASPARLWSLVSDIDLPARFSDEFQGAVWLAPAAGPAVGAFFEGTNHLPGMGEWKVRCLVSEHVPERIFAWQPGGPDNTVATWSFSLDPTESPERTELTFTAQLGTGRSNLTPMIEANPDREADIIARRLEMWRANMQATVDGIAELAERPGA